MQKSSKKKYYREILTTAIILLTLLIGGVIFKNKPAVKPFAADIPLVRTQKISPDETSQTYSYSGEVRGRYESQLAFQASGKIIRRDIESGSLVTTGQALMRIDPIDIKQGVDAKKAQVLAAQSQFKLAQDNLERFQEVYQQKLMSKAELERYQNAYNAALALLQQAKAQYTQGANQLNYCNLYADSAGVVATVYAEVGQVVAAGQPVVVLVKGNEREIEINVPENRLADLNKGQPLKVTFWALPNVAAEGRVREISPVADKLTRTYRVRVSLLNPPSALKLGMTATVTTTERSNQAAAYIPLTAIYQTGDTPEVWVVSHGVVRLKPIKLGAFGEDNQVQVLEGIDLGDRIVTAGVHKLRPGEKVRIGDDIE
jgi:multidrug efflux system membrane fusion protein